MAIAAGALLAPPLTASALASVPPDVNTIVRPGPHGRRDPTAGIGHDVFGLKPLGMHRRRVGPGCAQGVVHRLDDGGRRRRRRRVVQYISAMARTSALQYIKRGVPGTPLG